jgi:transketolase C-terminal domain/subunit
MSNVTHAKSWQESSSPNDGPLLSEVDGLQVSTGPVASGRFGVNEMLSKNFDLTKLAVTLRRLFDAGGDRFLWGLSEGERHTRVDAEHEVHRPNAELTPPAASVPAAAEGSWLVVIDSAHNLAAPDRIEQFRALLGSNPRTLLVALDSGEAEAPTAADAGLLEQALAALSAATGLEQTPPIVADDVPHMIECVADIKRRDRAALLRVTPDHATAGSITSPGEGGQNVEMPGTEPRFSSSLQEVASAELARRAALDERISIAVARTDRQLLGPWSKLADRVVQMESTTPLLLQWSSALALEGGRPFVFVSLQDLLGGFGHLLHEVCLRRAAVTLIVRPHDRSHDDEIVSSAALSGFRQLPHLSVLSPKDSIELSQMLEWTANQDDPALIWLPDAYQRNYVWGTDELVDRGRIERLGVGKDVAIMAWGPMVAAASLAAESLADLHIDTTVVNARFVQPLERDEIVRAARDSLVTVIIDDAEETGGFSSWVLDHLVRAGVTQPIIIVAPPADLSPHDPHEAQRQCAWQVVERCRWLADPVDRLASGAIVPVVPCSAEIPAPHVWFGPRGLGVDDRQNDQQQVLAQQFSPFIERWVAQYETVGTRDVYLWRWCLHGLNLTTLPSVTPELRASACDAKLLSIILCVLLDDVADQHGGGALLDALLEMASCGVSPSWSKLSEAEQKHGQVTRAVWDAYWERVSSFPYYAVYEPVLRYDLLQFFNTMRYSHLVNGRPYLLNLAEHDVYTPHNMMMISFATLDLMCSPGFPQSEVGPLREMVWHAQCMGRIGNLLSTWQREVVDRDYTSGVFARALVSGDLTLDTLAHGDAGQLESAVRHGNHEAYFLEKWFEHRRSCHALAGHVHWCDLTSVLEGHDRFFAMHLGSRGQI